MEAAVSKTETLRDLIGKNNDALRALLPQFMSVDRFAQIVITELSRTPKLQECTVPSLFGAIVQCAQLGLEPGIQGLAYLVPFWNAAKQVREVQLIPGYKGLILMARRAEQISRVDGRVVYQGDKFDYQFGVDQFLHHKPGPVAKRGDKTHYYFIVRLTDGQFQFDVKEMVEIEAHRDRFSKSAGKAADRKTGPWVTDFDAMALKTVARLVLKLCPAPVEIHKAVALDEYAESFVPQNLGALVAPSMSLEGPDEPGEKGPAKQPAPPKYVMPPYMGRIKGFALDNPEVSLANLKKVLASKQKHLGNPDPSADHSYDEEDKGLCTALVAEIALRESILKHPETPPQEQAQEPIVLSKVTAEARFKEYKTRIGVGKNDEAVDRIMGEIVDLDKSRDGGLNTDYWTLLKDHAKKVKWDLRN